MKNFLRQNLPILSIILLGAFLRFYRLPEYVIFLGDEGRDALAVYNILHGQLTLLGPTASVGGFFMGPIYYYLIAPFFFLSNYHPAGAGYMVAVLGLATIALIYWLGKTFFNRNAGLIAALLYAIAPIIIVYSRSSWNPNILPFFSLATLLVIYKSFEKNNKSLFIAVGILLGICLQLHYISIFLGVTVFVYILINEWIRRSNLKSYVERIVLDNLLIFSGFLIGFSPFLLFEIRHGFQNIQNILRFILSSSDTGFGNQIGYTITFVITRLFGGLVFNFPSSTNLVPLPKQIVSLWYGVPLIAAGASFIFIAFLLKPKNPENIRKYSLLLLWGLIGIFLFGMYKKSIYDYYFAFLFPLPFILIGALSSKLLAIRGKSLVSFILFASGLSLVLLSVISALAFSPFKTEPNNQYNQVETISKMILEKSEGARFNFALLSKGNSDHAYRYIFKLKGREAQIIETPVTDPSRKTITDQLFVLCDYKECWPLGNPLWEVAGFGQAKITGEWNTSIGKLYKLAHDGSASTK